MIHFSQQSDTFATIDEPTLTHHYHPKFIVCLFSWGFTFFAATAKSLQSCPTLCDPIDGSPPGSPSLGFSRQEYWSGLPFPSPVHENEKWKWSRSVVSDSSRPHGLQPTRLLCPWDFPGKSTGVGCHCLLHAPSLGFDKCICYCIIQGSFTVLKIPWALPIHPSLPLKPLKTINIFTISTDFPFPKCHTVGLV